MVDVNKPISDLLKDIATIELADTESETKGSFITIQVTSNSSEAVIKGKDYLSRAIIQIDCYADTPKQVNEMAIQVNERMIKAGFSRSNGKQFGRQRYMMTFKALIDENLNVYREE